MWYKGPREKIPEGLLSELTAKQKKLREQIIIKPIDKNIKTIAGCDSALIEENIFSVFVVFSFPELVELEVSYGISKITLPYIPGFLSFREIPNLIKVYEKLRVKPDVIMVDGQGIMHPRRMGIATQLGITLNVPTFGVAKKKLTGKFDEPGETKGAYSFVYDHEEVIGVAMRSKDKVKPVFVSPGHLCDLNSAIELTLKTLIKHKLPEPTRIADKYSKEWKWKVSEKDVLKAKQ